MRKNLATKLIQNEVKKRILGILTVFSVGVVPISSFAVSGSTHNEILAANEPVNNEVLVEEMISENTDDSSNKFLSTVGQTTLLAIVEPQSSYKNVSVKQSIAIPESKKSGRVPATAYSSTPDQTDDSPFITANGTHVHDGTLAANFLPFGTKVKFPNYSGDKVYIVEDRMNKRYDYKIDLWFPTRSAALQFGFQYLDYEVVE